MRLDDIFTMLRGAGHSVYYVGGYVRNLILQVPANDIDLVTSATPDEMRSIFGDSAIDTNNGAAFGTLMVVTSDHGTVEITTMREDIGFGRHQTEVTFTTDLLKDLSRRDFTLNAVAMAKYGSIIDPYRGVEHARQCHLVAVYGLAVGEALDRAPHGFKLTNVLHHLQMAGRISDREDALEILECASALR